jgi:hypothetical protein
MATVNTSCPACGKLMAVTENLLGQKVRCPHCQQAVTAPAKAPTNRTELSAPSLTESCQPTDRTELATYDPDAPSPRVQDTSATIDHESIFAPPDPDAALFDGAAPPQVELPIDSAAAVPAPPPADAVLDSQATVASSGTKPSSAQDVATPRGIPATALPSSSPPPSSEVDLGGMGGARIAPAPVVQSAARPGPESLRFALIVIPLISYAILATIAVLILYFRPPPPDPLEQLLDIEGDFKGATRQQQGSVSYERIRPDRPLPAKLRLGLNQKLRIGDVEVTPLKVELRRLVFHNPGFQPERGSDDSLVLHLHYRNASTDVVFCPTDPFFERRWKSTQSAATKPYMFLDLGQQRIYGGPCDWKAGMRREVRESIAGQLHLALRPGEEVTTFVCTDPDDHVSLLLDRYQGRILWRVQVRRGLVRVGDREVPATAVIGVEFDAGAVTRADAS